MVRIYIFKKGKIKKYVVLFRPSWSHGLWCRLLFLIWIFEKTIDMFVLFCHFSGAVQRVAGAVHGFFHIASVVPSFSHGRWKYTRNCAIFSMVNAIRHVSEVPLQTAIIGSMALQAFQPGSCCFVRQPGRATYEFRHLKKEQRRVDRPCTFYCWNELYRLGSEAAMYHY